ncbi:AMP-binding protein [Croceicoccus mobilis]|uniref:3-methylmercaptopropionyl-CoA ligase n=1 Tax=Croceicoccus mobilis TaxID=1703339 RepID=A0A917DYF8_9SPHN|nr:AMP-binding protein [Croceicoccus mobilis]GGD80788.1 acyl-CoA synthetase [Croceicoccus mobilis]
MDQASKDDRWRALAVPTFHAVVRDHARSTPDAPAIVFAGRSTSYAELDRLADRGAALMQARGIVPGSRVLFIGRNCDAIAVFALAAERIGAVPVPLNWRLAPEEMVRIAADCETPLVFATDAFRALDDQITARIGADILSADMLVAPLGDAAPDPVDLVTDPETIALQVYTSGTTGAPKGVMLSHRAMLGINTVRARLEWDRWGADDVTLVSAPLGHIGAFGMMARALFFGGCCVIEEQFEVKATLEAIEHYRVTKLALVPTAIKMLLDHPDAVKVDFSSLDQIVYGSAPITPDLLQRAIAAFGCRFVQSYGQTETSGPVVALPPGDHDPGGSRRMTGAGLPMPETEVRIVAPGGQPLRAGETGEILIRSVANMSGYWKRQSDSRAALDSDGWVHTGDAGYLDQDGYLYVRSRVKEMIITGAENVYPAEVESAFSAHPDVAEVAAIGVPDPHWGEAVVAIVVPRRGTKPEAQAMREWARPLIAGYKLPKTIHFVSALPLTTTGKVDKRALTARFSVNLAPAPR